MDKEQTVTGARNAPLHCNVKKAKDAQAAVYLARELIHPSKWIYSGNGNGMDELLAIRAMRLREGVFGAFQRRGYWRVEFTPKGHLDY